ncbi:MAG: L,D-transpeptidase family protein [Candidatus Krumholzibacteriota bacterium]
MAIVNNFQKYRRNEGAPVAVLALMIMMGALFFANVGAAELLRFEHPETLDSIYQNRENRPIWVSGGELNPSATTFLAILRNADREGLRPSDYLEGILNCLADHSDPPDIERRLTDTFLSFGLDLARGRIDPQLVYDRWDDSSSLTCTIRILADMMISAPAGWENPGFDPDPALDRIRPDHFDYQRLRTALGHYRQEALSGKRPAIPGGEILRLGDLSPRVPLLRVRLTGTAGSESFDDDLAGVVRSFQDRHGLQVDGLVGEKTLAALNETAGRKADRIAMNMERIRWLPEEPDTPFIRVNIPSCRLDLMDQGRSVLSMRTIVGRPDRPTPVMIDEIVWLEINPYWNVPQKLVRRDILPKILKDSGYLTDREFRVFETWESGAEEIEIDRIDWASLDSWDIAFRFRQDPGPRNPLGRMKFLFPNKFSIYLHDTNQRDSFRRDTRFLSSGCVRLEDPDSLARSLFQVEDLAALVESGENRTLGLGKRVPIFLVYQTVWIDDSGEVNFAPDVYGYDARMMELLDGRGARTLVSNRQAVILPTRSGPDLHPRE